MIGHFANELALSRGPTPYPFLITVWHEFLTGSNFGDLYGFSSDLQK